MKNFSTKKKRVIISLLLTGLVLNLMTACGTNNSITQGKNDATGNNNTTNIPDRNNTAADTTDDHITTNDRTDGSGGNSVMDDIGNTAEDVANDVADGVQDAANGAKDAVDHLVGSANANNKMNR